jgi:hypothetical protein
VRNPGTGGDFRAESHTATIQLAGLMGLTRIAGAVPKCGYILRAFSPRGLHGTLPEALFRRS